MASRRGNFFKILDRAIGLRMMAWARRELAKSHLAQFPAQGLRGQSDAEFRENPLAQIDEPPAGFLQKDSAIGFKI